MHKSNEPATTIMKLVFPSALLAAALMASPRLLVVTNRGRKAARNISERIGCSLGGTGERLRCFRCNDFSEAERSCKDFLEERFDNCAASLSRPPYSWLLPAMQDMCTNQVPLVEEDGKHQRDGLDPLRRE